MSWIIPNWIFPPILHSLIFAFFFHFSFLLWIWLCLSAFYRCSKYNRFVISVPNFKGRIFVGISGGSNWLLSCHASSWNCQGKQMTYDMWVAAVSYVITGQKWGGSRVEGGGTWPTMFSLNYFYWGGARVGFGGWGGIIPPPPPLYIKVWADQISISLVGNKLSYGIWSLMWTKNYLSWVIYYKYVIFQK